MIVLDASAVIDYLLAIPPKDVVIATRMAQHAGGIGAPHLLDVEVAQVLRGFVAAASITAARAEDALTDLRALPIQRYPHGPLLGRAFQLRSNATMYDAIYIVLAEGLGATLVTRDGALGKIPGHAAQVEVV